MTNKPNLFIVGAPKCGTTALTEYLKKHPNVYMSSQKEPHYFACNFPKHRVVDSLLDYERLFEAAGPECKVVGEASALYMYSGSAIERIREYNQDSRLIVMLRNPIDFVHSFHMQALYDGDEDQRDFKTAWNLQKERSQGKRIPPRCRAPALLQYANMGSLGSQLARVYAIFPRHQVLVVIFDDFITQTSVCYRSVLHFLGLEDDGRSDFPPVNVNKAHRSFLLAQLAHYPPARLRQYWLWAKHRLGLRIAPGQWLRMANTRINAKRPMDPRFRNELKALFKPEILKLEVILNRPLYHWYEPDA